MTAPKIRVVAGVIERDGRFLICRRPLHKRHGGLWEFPGGKVEEGESDLLALRRELNEELAVVVVEVGSRILSIDDPGSPYVIEFLPARISGDPDRLEHADLAWMTPEEMMMLPLAPGDAVLVEHLMSLNGGVIRGPGQKGPR